MTRTDFLETLKAFTEIVIKDMVLPVRKQENDKKPPAPRAADVHLMRLPDSKSATKKAPYIIHQVITGKDTQPEGERAIALTVVRSIICVYHENEQEGALTLLSLMERLRVALLETVVIGNKYTLITEGDGLEALIYPDDTAPYYAGEMISTWRLPGIKRKVDFNNGF